jgi:hypothetical protein
MGAPPPSWSAGNRADVERRARQWLSSPQLETLIRTWDRTQDADLTPAGIVEWSAAHLDTRGGRERREAPPVAFTPARASALRNLAGSWGMLETRPPERNRYGATVILGGATTGNRLRSELAKDCAASGTTLGPIVAAAAARPITEHERETDPDAAEETAEWENLLRNLDASFGSLSPEEGGADELQSEGWLDRRFSTPAGGSVRLLVAPAGEGRRRADTADVLRFLQARLPLREYSSLLVITSAIYVPYQFFVAAPPLLAAGARHVELIGTPTSIEGDPHLLAQRLGQEVHAGVVAAARLLDSAE